MNPIDSQRAVEDWNREYPIGTPVIRYKLIKPLRQPELTLTRGPAWLMGGHSAMIMVEGVAGGVLLESVAPLLGLKEMPLMTAHFSSGLRK